MIRVLIVDDEPPARRKVRRFLNGDPEISEVEECGDGAQAIDMLRRYKPDLLFLDVQMPGKDGFAVLESVAQPHDFHVIFLTAHDHHALRAFEAEALDYLLKPVDPNRFDRALERAKEQIALRRGRNSAAETRRFLKRIVVEKNRREILLPVEQIDWVESDRNYICLHVSGETYIIRTTLESLLRQLDPDQFTRISRSEVVNLDRVREMKPWFHGERRVVLKDGSELTWTRRFRATLSQP